MTDAALSEYQGIKIWLAEVLPVDRDILHVLLGAVIVAAAFAVFRRKTRAALAGTGVAALGGILMEVLDLRDAWFAGLPPETAHSAGDLLRTVFIPSLALLVMAGWTGASGGSGKRR